MKNITAIFVGLILLPLSANAQVFKCKQASGKIIYQTAACKSGAVIQKVIKVKELTPEQAEEARVKLDAWKQQQAVENATKQEAEKQRQAALEKQESLELQRRGVVAQEKQAIAEQQRQNPPNIVVVPRLGGGYLNNGNDGYLNHGGLQRDESLNPNMMPPQYRIPPPNMMPSPYPPPPSTSPIYSPGTTHPISPLKPTLDINQQGE